MIRSLDPEEWGAAWMAIGDRYMERAKRPSNRKAAAGRSARGLAALHAWPLAGRKLRPRKSECYAKAKAAFEAYGRLIDPKIETAAHSIRGQGDRRVAAAAERRRGRRW